MTCASPGAQAALLVLFCALSVCTSSRVARVAAAGEALALVAAPFVRLLALQTQVSKPALGHVALQAVVQAALSCWWVAESTTLGRADAPSWFAIACLVAHHALALRWLAVLSDARPAALLGAEALRSACVVAALVFLVPPPHGVTLARGAAAHGAASAVCVASAAAVLRRRRALSVGVPIDAPAAIDPWAELDAAVASATPHAAGVSAEEEADAVAASASADLRSLALTHLALQTLASAWRRASRARARRFPSVALLLPLSHLSHVSPLTRLSQCGRPQCRSTRTFTSAPRADSKPTVRTTTGRRTRAPGRSQAPPPRPSRPSPSASSPSSSPFVSCSRAAARCPAGRRPCSPRCGRPPFWRCTRCATSLWPPASPPSLY